MLTVGDMATTDSPAGLRRRCLHCNARIIWATAYLGQKLPFDAEPIPRRYDYDNVGWIPGRFDINGRLRTCYAPLPLHPLPKRRRASHVMTLHGCRKAAAA